MGEIIVKAKRIGILKLGDQELPCFVLDNKKRVLSMREVVELLTGNRKGGLVRYISAKNVRKFMPTKYIGKQNHEKAVIKFTAGGRLIYGYEANDVIDICKGYLSARLEKALNLKTQGHLAVRAEIIVIASAKVGLEALIDEATGYQAERDAEELQIKFKAYIADELRQWTQTFPLEFFHQCYRLEGIAPPLNQKTYPKRFGRYVMRFVYDTMDRDVADWLRKNNPDPTWDQHHHQWLTEDFGYPRLIRHLMSIIGIQKASTTMENFVENVYRAYPDARPTRMKRLAAERRRALAEKGQVELEFTHI